jgi:hypothetical protein
MTAMNEACSAPVHVAITFTDPALWVPPPPHATAANTAAIATTSARMRLEERMFYIPHVWKVDDLPVDELDSEL